MNATIAALLAYVVWMLVLLGMLAYIRTSLTLTGKRQANSFDPSGIDVSPFSNRLCRTNKVRILCRADRYRNLVGCTVY
ncbi:MAG: hypothetical protein IIC62_03620 [Proteobacteria bacterium]|nr:hypothetical protein [Pseudomonadota bacterium]